MNCLRSLRLLFRALLLSPVVFVMTDAAGQAPPQPLPPLRATGGHWVLRWTSESGRIYRLERSLDLAVWTEVTTVTATGTETAVTDPGTLDGKCLFWRVLQVGTGPDSSPPAVSIIDARLVDQAGATALELRVRATDNVSVVGVNYTEGATQLGAATSGPVQTWTRIVPLVPGATNPRQFQAVARDAAGNSGFSEIYTFRPQQAYPSGMRPLGGAGASPGGVIGERTNGSLNPFTYMPDSNAGGSVQRAMRMDFPEGATLVNAAGQQRFQFSRLVFGFGPQSPLQFDPGALPQTAPLTSDPLTFGGKGIVLALPAGQTAQVATGALPFETVRTLLGLPAGTALPMRLFNRFPILWKGGSFTQSGIKGGKFSLPNIGLPLPPDTGEYAHAVIDLLSGQPADFPIHGTWPLPGTGATMTAAKARPVILTLKPNGSIALNGPVTLSFANNVRVQGLIVLDDPVYKFCLEADTISVPLMTVLEVILPNNAANCIPAGFDDATLDHAEECLRSFDRAYRTFLQAALNLRPDAANDAALGATPGPHELVGAAVECFAATAAVDVAASLPLQAVRDFVSSGWRPSIVQTDDYLIALKNLTTVRRYKEALQRMVDAGPSSPDEAALLADAVSTQTDAINVVVALSSIPQTSASLERVTALVDAFIDLTVGPTETVLVEAGRRTIRAYLVTEAARLGVQSGALDFRTNPTIMALDYGATLQETKHFVAALAEAGRLGIGESSLPLAPEIRVQLLQRAGSHLTSRLEALISPNLAVVDPFAALLVCQDVLDFSADLQLIGQDPAELGLPGENNVEAVFTSLNQTILDSLTGIGPPVSELFDSAVALNTALEMLAVIDAGAATPVLSQRRIHTLLQEHLFRETGQLALGAADGPRAELVLRAGVAFASLARHTPGVTTTFNWESTPVGDVAQRLAEIYTQQTNWLGLRRLLDSLLTAAGQLEKEGEQAAAAGQSATAQARQQSRKRYLNVVAGVLVTARPAILAYWQQSNNLRNQQPASAKADGALPGDLSIDRLRGCLGYNRSTQVLSGSFGGRIGFPADGAFFEIVSAAISSNGTFNIQAATQLPLEPFGNPNVTLGGTLAVAGTNAGLQSVSGTGTLGLKVPGQNGAPAGLRNFTVTYGYNATAPGQPLTLAAALATQNAPLMFGDDFVLFGGSLSAEWRTGSPGGFTIGIGGRAGMFHREAPLAAPVTELDFWSVAEINRLALSFDAQKARATFTGGVLQLPADLFVRNTPGAGGDLRTRVTMTGELCVDVPYATGLPQFCAGGNPAAPFTVAFDNFHFAVPGVPQSRIGVTNCTVEFFQNNFPVMKNLAANFQFPLPGMNATDPQQHRLLSLDVTGKDWRIDGFPREVSFALAQSLRIADYDGLDVDLLGGTAVPGCATSFSLTSQSQGGQQRAQLTLNGGMRVAFEQALLDNADAPGSVVAATACGSFAWDFASLPAFTLSVAQIQGRFALGGPNGVKIGGAEAGQLASLTFTGLDNMHRLTTLSPFKVGFTGALEVANFVKFALKDANMTWNGSSLIPAVTLGGVQTSLGSEAVELAQGFLPVYPTGMGAEFANPGAPLFPTAGQTGLFDPLNIRLLVSGAVSIPPPVASVAGGGAPSDLPGISGSVDNLGIGLQRQGNLIVPNLTLNGLGLKLSGIDVPPLGGLNGSLYVGNLSDPANLYFAGSLGGTVNDVGAKIGMGVHRSKGLLGAVFDLDIGPAGIPLDGGVLGGILLTGGSGGLSFGNTFAQPEDFLNSIQFTTVNGEKRPVNDGTPDAFTPTGAPSPLTYPTAPPAPAPGQNSCITGEFPPATINPLCKPHPTIAGRIIFKGTNLHPTTPNTDFGFPITLNSIGITPAVVPASINAAVTFGVDRMMQPARDFVDGLVSALPPVVDAKVKDYYASLLNKQLRQLESTAAGFLRQALGQAIGLDPNASLYEAIVDAAAQGIPCLDATMRLQGNFSHAAVSTVLKGKGAITLSTTGTATLDGTIELIGIPVGEGVLALSLTDSNGDINPSFGGVLHAGVGPLTLGDMSMSYQCDGCFTAVLNAFQTFLALNAETMGAASRELLVEMMNRTVPVTPSRALSGDPGAFFMELNDRQKLAFVASLFNIVQVLGDGQPLPQGITTQVVSGFIGSFQQFVSDVLLQVNPRFCFQAKVKPAIFGFPLVPGPTPLDARFAYEKVHDQTLNQDFQQLSANAVFSPAFIMSALVTGQFAMLVPTADQANLGFSFRMPAFTPQTVDLAMRNPGQFALNQFTTLVQDSTMTFGYAFMPLGIPLAEGQARIVMPRLINHPTNPGRPRGSWEAPAPAPYVPPAGTAFATRDEVIIAALVRGRLQDPNWRGVRGELDDLFFQPFAPPPAPGSPQERVTQVAARLDAVQMNTLGFAEDYFPHGGIIGASQLQLPAVIAQAPPAALIAKVFDVSNPDWLTDAQDLFQNYLSANSVVGQMAAYIPAPNVPQGFDFQTGSPQDLIDSLITGDPLAIMLKTAPAGVYPFDQVTLAGWMKAQLLGMPLGDATVRFDGASGTFKAQAAIAGGSWLSSFIGASAELEIKKPAILANPPAGTSLDEIFAQIPQKTVQERFIELQATLATANVTQVINTIQDTLPKARLEVAANVQIPAALAPYLRSTGGGSAQFFAFSLGFDRNFLPADFSPYAVAKRRGGLGFKGAFQAGHFPAAGQPIVIDIPDASFAITPSADPSLFPALTAQLRVNQIAIPGAPALRNGVLQFASSPDNHAPYLAVAGTMDPFKFSLPRPGGGTVDLLNFRPLNAGGTIGGNLRITREDGAPANTGVALAINPMSAAIPMLGPQVAVTVHGGAIGGVFQPLSFSTQTGQPWSAQVALSAPGNPNGAPTFGICDPFDPANPQCLMTFTPSGPVAGAITGTGMDSFQMQFTVPTGFTMTLFPGAENQSSVAMPAGDDFTIYLDSTGRFYCDLGALTNVSLPGLITANAKIEFGYNPSDPQPNVSRSPLSLNFGTVNLADSVSQPVLITNTGTLAANISLSIFQAAGDVKDFDISTGSFQLEPGGSRTVPVVFQPKRSGARSATLNITSEDPDSPLLGVPLSGTGLQEPRYFQSRDTIAFGDTLVGATAIDTITIGNTGSANMLINTASVSGAGFTVSPAGPLTLTPGTQRVFTLTFTPAVPGAASGPLTLNAASPIGPKTLTVSGTGSESRWLTLLDSSTAGSVAQLNALKMLNASRGLVVGEQGAFLETTNGGRSWIPRRLTNQSLHAIAVDQTAAIDNTPLALYHFEEPPGSTAYLDATGNGLHGVAVASPGTAALSFANGRFGSGLNFDGTDDYAELGSVTLPSSFSISVWAYFRETTNNQAIVSKATSTGVNQLLFGKYNDGLQVIFGSQVFTVPHVPALNVWTHFVITGSFDSVANTTAVSMFRRQDGGSAQTLGSNVFTGAISTSGGKRWSLGQEWDSSTLTSDHFNGRIDEAGFYDGVLSSGERSALFLTNGTRLVVAGNGGRVYQTFTDGDTWGQLPDLNAFGWRNQSATFVPHNWFSAAFRTGDLYLGGSIGAAQRLVMREDLNAGLDGVPNTPDDEFDQVSFSNAAIGAFPAIRGLASVGTKMLGASNEGVVYSQDLLVGEGAPFTSLSPTTAPTALNDIVSHGVSSQYVAVGNAGVILGADGGAHAARVSNTTSNLHAVVFDSNVTPSYHAAGDGGVYLTSANNGLNWQNAPDGLTGNMQTLDVEKVPGGAAGEYHVWAAGANHTINYRPPVAVTGPFFTFFPGKLDFGFVTTNQSKTLTVTLANRGKQPLQISSFVFTGPAAARFSLGQTTVNRLEPGDSTELSVRYRPTVSSEFDAAELILTTNDPTPAFRLALEGRSASNEWQPVSITSAGATITGEVIKVDFFSDNLGYAIVNPPAGASRLYRTSDGGAGWTQVGSNLPNVGGTIRLTCLATASIGADIIYVGGRVENASGGLIKGVLLVGQVAEQEIAPGQFVIQEAWSETTPLPAGQSTQPLAIADVATYVADGTITLVAATTGSTTTANVFRKNPGDSTWTTLSTRPSATFSGGPVAVAAYAAATGAVRLFATSSTELFSAATNASAWPADAKRFQTSASSPIRDLDFHLTLGDSNGIFSRGWLVGDDGLFFRLTGSSPVEPDNIFPASDAEVFGTTDLAAVDFSGPTTGWVVGASRVFESNDEGSTWSLNFDAGGAAALRCVKARPASKAWVGGSLDSKATVWRYTPPAAAARGLLTSVDQVDFSTVTPETSPTRAVRLTNTSATALPLHDFSIDADEPAPRFSIVSDLPDTIAAGGFVDLTVAFDALAEKPLAGDLRPEFLHRFEQAYDDSVLRDDSLNARHSNGAVPAAQRPKIVRSAYRDRCVLFDGADDRVELSTLPPIVPFDLMPAGYSVALWAAPESVSGTRTLLSKDLNAGTDGLKISQSATGYQVKILTSTVSFTATPVTEWTHLAFVFKQGGASTQVTFYLNGALTGTQTAAAVAGNLAGRPWTIGAEWTSNTATAASFSGCLDDVALFSRGLTDADVTRLMVKSPLFGEHRAQLVVNSGSERGSRAIDLRALVAPAPRMLVFNTEPQGRQVTIDGVDFTTPVAFVVTAVASGASASREWVEGSEHRITTRDETFPLTAADGTVTTFGFAEWQGGTARSFNLTASRSGTTAFTAVFQPRSVTPAAPVGPPPPRPGGPNPLLAGLANSPKGPFFRLSGGQIKLPKLGATGFDISGELLVSLQKIKGHIASSALNLPETGAKQLEIGASRWAIDATAGGNFLLLGRPPSLRLLGYDALPSGDVALRFTKAAGDQKALWGVEVNLRRDFKPVPNVLEFKRGFTKITWQPDAPGLPVFALEFQGGLRLLKQPNGLFAFDRTMAVKIDSANFTVDLNTLLAAAGLAQPARLFQIGPFEIGWGDVRLRRTGGGPVFFEINGVPFICNGQLVVNVSGSVNSSGALDVTGTLPQNGRIHLVPSGQFFLEKTTSGSASFHFLFEPQPLPRLVLSTPSLQVKTTASGANGNVFPSGGITVPGFDIDTGGAFNTGKIPLPAFDFDGIDIAGKPGGKRDNNHIKLKRDAAGKVTFKIKSEQTFVTCRQKLSLTVESRSGSPKISGSFQGNFCVLPDDLSLSYNSGSQCQFSASAFGFTVKFGSTCAGVENNATGVCVLGTCN